jgi:hypothetical protein
VEGDHALPPFAIDGENTGRRNSRVRLQFVRLLLTLLWQVADPRQMPDFDAIVLKQVATEVRNIKAEYRGIASEESIDLVASQSLRNLANSKVPQFVPLFVGRFTRERLRELTGFRPHVEFGLMTR